MPAFALRLFKTDLDRLLEGRDGPVTLHVANVGRQARGRCREYAPYDATKNGVHLRDTMDMEMVRLVGGWTARITARAPWASFVIDGTSPHMIQGNPLLVFFWKKVGTIVAFHSVNHPGTKPNNFMRRALESLGLRGFR